MIGKAMLRISFCLSCLFLVSCATVRDSVVDHAAGFPASQVISDVKSTSDEYEKEMQEERVEELNQEYEEFLRTRETDNAQPESKQSVVIKRDDGNQDWSPTALSPQCAARVFSQASYCSRSCLPAERQIREAIEFHLEGLRADDLLVPPASSRVDYVDVAA